MKVIAIIGPESTGKTTLAQSLAHFYKAQWLPEYAREYLTNLKKTYVEADLLNMAQGQYVNQKASLKTQDTHVFWDTDLHVINIWSKYKFGHSHRWIRKYAAAQRVDLYLLTHYDIPYEQDPLRENPHNRKELFEIYLDYVLLRNLPHAIIKGDQDTRLAYAIKSISELSH